MSLEKLKNETMRKTAEDEIDDILDAQSTRTDDDAATDIDKAMAPASFARTYAMQAPFQPGRITDLSFTINYNQSYLSFQFIVILT